MLSKLKILSLTVISFLLALLGLQHYRNKSEKLAKELENQKLASKVSKATNKAMLDAQQEAIEEGADEIERSKNVRDYFSRH